MPNVIRKHSDRRLQRERDRGILAIEREHWDELTRVGYVLPEAEAKVKGLDCDLI